MLGPRTLAPSPLEGEGTRILEQPSSPPQRRSRASIEGGQVLSTVEACWPVLPRQCPRCTRQGRYDIPLPPRMRRVSSELSGV